MKQGGSGSTTTSKENIKFNSAAYFSTPVWNATVLTYLKPMLKLSDGYLKQTHKKIMSKNIKERVKKSYFTFYRILGARVCTAWRWSS